MKTITFNKLQSKCLFCKKNLVERKRWNLPCEECGKKQVEEIKKESGVVVGNRKPAARLVNDEGHEVYVDKFGVEVDNPGYDLEHDPRGWEHTGRKPGDKTII